MLNRFRGWLLVAILIMACYSCKKDPAVFSPTPLPANDIVETEPPIQTPIAVKINEVINGLYSAVPVHYNETNKKYPLLIFISGAGQLGDNYDQLYLLLVDGVAKMIDAKKFPPSFNVNGKNFSFIVLTPQFSAYPSNEQVKSFIEYAKKTYRVDASRIYLSGLSMGGIVSTDIGAQYTNEIAAIAPISGVFFQDVPAKCEKMAKGKLPVWVFHNLDDPQVSIDIPQYFNYCFNAASPAIPSKLTVFPVHGHNAWDQALNPEYKENGMNVYEWMLQYTR